jgi:LuxR family maltose regulon positive regulatory protein
MTSPPLALSKLTPPKLPKIVERTRLFKQLTQARHRPIVWINAPPGMGKTTLVASYLRARKLKPFWYQVDGGDADPATFFHYLQLAAQKAAPRYRKPLPHLTPEYLPALPVFTRRFFEHLYSRLKSPTVVVFDNYQDLPATAPLQDLMHLACTVISDGLTMMVISREEPSPAYARLQAGQLLASLDQDLLRLTPEEAQAIVDLHGARKKNTFTIKIMGMMMSLVKGLMCLAGTVLRPVEIHPNSRAGKGRLSWTSADQSDLRQIAPVICNQIRLFKPGFSSRKSLWWGLGDGSKGSHGREMGWLGLTGCFVGVFLIG